MLRRLEFYGWIEIETDKSYVQRVNFKDYAVKIIKTLLEIEEGKQIEYQGYIYTIYSLVRSSTDNPGIVLISILENTDMLITGLKNLNSGIKRYIDELTKYRTPAEINQKNTQYQRAAINRAKFFLIGGEDVRGQLKEILSAMNEKINEENMDLGGIYRIAFLDEMIRIYSCGMLDEKSLYVPIEGKKEFRPVELINDMPDLELRQAKLKKMLEKMERVLNPRKIDAY